MDIDDQEPEFPRRPDMEPYILGPVPEEHSMEYCGTVDVAIDRDSHVNNSLIFYYIIGKKIQMGCCQTSASVWALQIFGGFNISSFVY